MLNFNETTMHPVLTFPKRLWQECNIYTFILAIPFMVLILTVAIPIALIIDIVLALIVSITSMFSWEG